MTNQPAANSPRAMPLRSALRDDSEKTPPLSGVLKAVQIAEPDASSIQALPPVEEIPIRQFPAGVAGRRLSGRAPPVALSSRASLISLGSYDGGIGGSASANALSYTSSPSQLPADDPRIQPSPSLRPHHLHQHHSHRRRSVDQNSSRLLLAQLSEWLQHERAKQDRRRKSKSGEVDKDGERDVKSVADSKASPGDKPVDEEAVDDEPPSPTAEVKRTRAASTSSNSSEVSLDRLQRILDDNMAAMGLDTLSNVYGIAAASSSTTTTRHSGSVSSASGRRQSRSLRAGHHVTRAVSSDTDYVDGDVLVPSCDAVLDNTKTLKYAASAPQGISRAPSEVGSLSGRREEKERQAWLNFKNEILRLAHTLRLKGWRKIPLESGETISVERLSGALTNAVYVVSPPSEAPSGDSFFPAHAGAATKFIDPTAPKDANNPGPRSKPSKLLLRIYGPQVEHLIDREKELSVLRRLARKKIGPRLLGTFANGRFEQYFVSTTLTASSMREPETSRMIAKRMRELHDGVQLLEEELDSGPTVWRNWDKWLDAVERTITYIDQQVLATEAEGNGNDGPVSGSDAWKYRGLVCGVEWPKFRELAEKYRQHVLKHYGGSENIRKQLVFAHNDTQYGNILRMRPDERSPLLQPENEHKQLVVIDFEYAAANVPGLEFANHFTEWTYNYHDAQASHACTAERYPTPEQQRRFIRAYVDHRPEFPHQGGPNTPRFGPQSAAVVNALGDRPDHTPRYGPLPSGGSTPGNADRPEHTSSSSIAEFMLDARAPSGGWIEEERKREELVERQVEELMAETRMWRLANSAMWVAWGIVQAKVPGLTEALAQAEGTAGKKEGGVGEKKGRNGNDDSDSDSDAGGAELEEEFDYLAYAQDRAMFFLGDCVQAGLVKLEELPTAVQAKIKIVEY